MQNVFASYPITLKSKSFQTKHHCEAFRCCVPAPVYFSQLSSRYISRSITVGASHGRTSCFDKKAPSIEAHGVKHSNWQVCRTERLKIQQALGYRRMLDKIQAKTKSIAFRSIVEPFVKYEHQISLHLLCHVSSYCWNFLGTRAINYIAIWIVHTIRHIWE